MNEPINWMKKHYNKYGNFKVAAEFSKKYWKYFTYKSREFFEFWNSISGFQPNHRYIFDDEIVIEGDLPDRKQNYENSKIIDKLLETKNLSYYKFYSGNKSYHYHLYFPQLKKFEGYSRQILKKKIISWIMGCDNKCMHKHCNVSRFGIDFQLTGKHLVRMEYGVHIKTGRRKILLKKKDYGVNFIPKSIIKEQKEIDKKLEQVTKINISKIHASKNCIDYFLSTNIKDCRKRVLFVLINQFASIGMSGEMIFNSINEWNSVVLKKYFKQRDIIPLINRALKDKKVYFVGCTYIKNNVLEPLGKLSLCKGCPFALAKKNGEHKKERS